MATGHFSTNNPSHAFIHLSECFVTLEIQALTFVQKHGHVIQFFFKVWMDVTPVRAFIVGRNRPHSDQKHFVHEGQPLFSSVPILLRNSIETVPDREISTWRSRGQFAINIKAAIAAYLSEAPNPF
jgi:hypothetical protein